MSKVNVETVKTESHGLFAPLAQDLDNSNSFLSEAGKVLIKFHGSYEQTNREKRGAKKNIRLWCAQPCVGDNFWCLWRCGAQCYVLPCPQCQAIQDLVPFNELVTRLVPVLSRFRDERLPNEAFGDFCFRSVVGEA